MVDQKPGENGGTAKRCGVYVALLHHSMRDKNGLIVTTAVTNLDIHDIARSSRTYGVDGYFLVNPVLEQQDIVKRIIQHWNGSGGKDYNPDRSEAFSRVRIVSWLHETVKEIENLEGGRKPELYMTSARKVEGMRSIGWGALRELLQVTGSAPPKLLVFGTGWGMTDEILREADGVVDPILPQLESGYNHLSVRSAVAIALDRLLGEKF